MPACYNPSSYEVESVVLTSPIQDSVVSNISFSLPTDLRTTFNFTLTDGQGVELLFVNIQISKLNDGTVQTMLTNVALIPHSMTLQVRLTFRI